jgi:putative membrane protein
VSIKLVSGEVLGLVLKGQIRAAIKRVPFRFLVPLATGLFSAILSLSHLMSYLLKSHTDKVFGFFFGLVLASTVTVLGRVHKWKRSDIAILSISAMSTYLVVGGIPVETSNNLIVVFVSGVIAICAMILPGISGSFILLLLGKYQYILGALNNKDLLVIGVFMTGCIVGLSLFARFLIWLFHHHHDISVIILAGIMLGSIRKIWPWQEVVLTRVNSHGEVVPLIAHNILPSTWGTEVILVISLAVIGYLLVWYMDRLHVTKETMTDIDDPAVTKAHKQGIKTY